jgi:hypothetical protein
MAAQESVAYSGKQVACHLRKQFPENFQKKGASRTGEERQELVKKERTRKPLTFSPAFSFPQDHSRGEIGMKLDAMPSPSESGAAEALPGSSVASASAPLFHHVVVQPRNQSANAGWDFHRLPVRR